MDDNRGCEGRRSAWRRGAAYDRYLKRAAENAHKIPTEYVLCSQLGPILRICYPDAPPCSKCGEPVCVAPSNQDRVDHGEPIVCSVCHFLPGYVPGHFRDPEGG